MNLNIFISILYSWYPFLDLFILSIANISNFVLLDFLINFQKNIFIMSILPFSKFAEKIASESFFFFFWKEVLGRVPWALALGPLSTNEETGHPFVTSQEVSQSFLFTFDDYLYIINHCTVLNCDCIVISLLLLNLDFHFQEISIFSKEFFIPTAYLHTMWSEILNSFV